MTMEGKAFLLLHVTDVHIKDSITLPVARAKCLGSALAQHFDAGIPVVLAIGGDLAWSGLREQYDLAQDFLKEIAISLNKAGFSLVKTVIAPGNHDCDFSMQNEHERVALYSGVQEIEKAKSLYKSMSIIQKEFHEFNGKQTNGGHKYGATITRFNVEEAGWASVDALNTSWGVMKEKREGHLPFIGADLPRAEGQNLNVLVAHHPPSWFIQEHRVYMERWIEENYDIVLYGHEHYNEEIEKKSRHLRSEIMIIAGSAFFSSAKSSEDGFSAMSISHGAESKVRQAAYKWNGDKFVLKGEVSEKDLKLNPGKKRHRKNFTNEFQAKLDDPGVQLSHPRVTRQIRLSEIFIEQKLIDLKSTVKDVDMALPVLASRLLGVSAQSNSGKISIILGPEQCGKTSLCKWLCLSAQASGLVPLLLDASSLQSTNSGEITSWINKSINETYLGGAEHFYDAEIKERIVIIDGLERIRGKIGAKKSLIERCQSYGGRVVATMSASSSTEGILSLGKDHEGIQDVDIYEFSPLSKKQVTEVIEKWLRLGQVNSMQEDDVRTRARQLAARISIMLGKHGLPPFPLSVLLLLQLTEALNDNTAIVADGSLGYIMEALIVSELQKVTTFPLNIAIGYLANFAWYLERNGAIGVDEYNFSEFHREFVRSGLTIDEGKIKKQLVASNFIRIDDGHIGFKYPYIFYFFLAKHLSAIETNNEAIALIDNLVKYIHTEKSASVLTFLAHFSSSDGLVDKLISKANQIHSSNKSVDFWVGSSIFSRFGSMEERALLLSYEEQSVEQEIADEELEYANSQHGEVTQLDMFPVEDDPFGWAGSLKIIHILGQVLRSRSTKMSIEMKEEIIASCLGVSRRTLGFAFDEIEKEAPALVHASLGVFEKLLGANKEKALRHANSFLGWLVVALCSTYLLRFGRACGAEEFSEMNSKLLSRSSDDNDKMFMLSARILGERKIVEDALVSFYEKAHEKHLLPTVLIKRLARYRLHLSPPEEVQRRRLARKLNIDGTRLMIEKAKDRNS